MDTTAPTPVEPDLADRYNDGLVVPPQRSGEPPRLPYPAWRPTPAQVEAAHQRLWLNLGLLALIVCGCLLLVALGLGWRP